MLGTLLAAGMHQTGRRPRAASAVLVLNASYEPINVCAARRAIVARAQGCRDDGRRERNFLHAARLAWRVPSVIRLLEYRRIRTSRVRSRARTFCCATATPVSIAAKRCLPANSLSTTSPALSAEPFHLENLVACCHPCNRRKGNSFRMK